MKKNLKLSFLFLILLPSIALSQVFSKETSLEAAARKTADRIATALTECGTIPADAKLTVAFFSRTDGVPTKFGIRLSEKVAFYLKLAAQEGKIKQTILFPDDINRQLDETMYLYFTVPEDQDAGDFWKKQLENQTPDFYLVGQYEFPSSKAYSELRISQVELRADNYGKYSGTVCGAKKTIVETLTETDVISECKKNDVALNRPNEHYEKLIEMPDNPNGFDAVFIESKTGKPVTDANFKIGAEYQIELNMKKDLNVYAFFYDPDDPDTKFMTMIFPYDTDLALLKQKGKHVLPDANNTFEVGGSVGRPVLVKIIATTTFLKLPLDVQKIDDYMIAVFTHDNCRVFNEELSKLSKTDLYSRTFSFSRN